MLHAWSRSRNKKTPLALRRILGQIFNHLRQQVHDAAEFFLSFDDVIGPDGAFRNEKIKATRTFER